MRSAFETYRKDMACHSKSIGIKAAETLTIVHLRRLSCRVLLHFSLYGIDELVGDVSTRVDHVPTRGKDQVGQHDAVMSTFDR
jgi:hypothetical protein